MKLTVPPDRGSVREGDEVARNISVDIRGAELPAADLSRVPEVYRMVVRLYWEGLNDVVKGPSN